MTKLELNSFIGSAAASPDVYSKYACAGVFVKRAPRPSADDHAYAFATDGRIAAASDGCRITGESSSCLIEATLAKKPKHPRKGFYAIPVEVESGRAFSVHGQWSPVVKGEMPPMQDVLRKAASRIEKNDDDATAYVALNPELLSKILAAIQPIRFDGDPRVVLAIGLDKRAERDGKPVYGTKQPMLVICGSDVETRSVGLLMPCSTDAESSGVDDIKKRLLEASDAFGGAPAEGGAS